MRKPAYRLILVISLFELLLSGGISAAQRAPPNATVAAPPLTLEARVACQQAIERIYWQHRLWPAQRWSSGAVTPTISADGRYALGTNGTQANWPSLEPDISADGSAVTFHSESSTFVPNDTGGHFDVFVHDTIS